MRAQLFFFGMGGRQVELAGALPQLESRQYDQEPGRRQQLKRRQQRHPALLYPHREYWFRRNLPAPADPGDHGPERAAPAGLAPGISLM